MDLNRLVGRLVAAGMLVIMLMGFPRGAGAQDELVVQDVNVSYNFGEEITFQARLDSPEQITQASVLFRQADEEVTRVETIAVDASGVVHFTYNASLNVLAPYSTVLFWFQAAFLDGSTRTSPVFNFHYDDNRFPWQNLSEPGLVVHWYDGDLSFAQAALDAARVGMNAIEQFAPVNRDMNLDVYIYSNTDDLQGALILGGRSWIGGHADPALGVTMVAIQPGDAQAIEMQTKIPHEIAHVLLYRDMGASYNRLPAWLSEGLASLVEAYPKPDYANALALASQDGSLIPMTELCDAFPPDSGRAFLAYAQSQSFTSFLRDSYGATGLSALIRAYGDGLDCDLGASRAVGIPLTQLDTRWREKVLGQNVAGVAIRNLVPYLIVIFLALIIPLWGVARMLLEKRHYERRAV